MNGSHFLTIDPTSTSSGRPFPTESGPIRISGSRWTLNGKPWFWRGATMFLLLERQMNGEDITPQINWMVGKGVNVARVFVAGVPWPGHSWLYEQSDWQDQLWQLASDLADNGLRLEATVCTDRGDDGSRWQPILQRVYDALSATAQTRESSFVEWINEPWVQGEGLTHATIDRRGILSAYGLQPPERDPHARILDYGTAHLPRDLDHVPRNSKDLLEFQDANRTPWVSDEPLGIAEYDKTGAGARTTDSLTVAGHFAIASLFGGGATIHSQCGLEGRCPSETEPITEELASMITAIWQFIPPEMPTGEYSAPHIGNFPLSWTHGDTDSGVKHAYASILGDTAYAVVPKPKVGYIAEGVNGWKVDAQLLPGIVRLKR